MYQLSEPNCFFKVLPYRGLYTGSIFFFYAFIANDTQANYFETTENKGYIAVWPMNDPYVPTPTPPIFPISVPFIVAIIIPFTIIGACIVYADHKWTDEKVRYDEEFGES